MNKKEYLQPQIIIVKVKTQHMIANSIRSIGGDTGISVGGTTQDAGVTTAGAKQSTYDVWGDDWSK